MPPISNCANLEPETFDLLRSMLTPLRRVQDVLRFAASQTPALSVAMGQPTGSGCLNLLVTRPSASLAFQFRLSSLEPDGEVLAMEIWKECPSPPA